MINNTKEALRTDINELRGISVLIVVIYHFNISAFHGGFIGVNFFFVISGFLMTKIIASRLITRNFNYLDLVVRRAERIFPALFFLISVVLVLGVAFLPPLDLSALALQIQSVVTFNSNNYFLSQNSYFSINVDNRWLLHSWSLSVKWQFYMLYPVFLWAIFSIDNFFEISWCIKISHILLVITFFLSLTYCIFSETTTSLFSIFSRSWQMIAGGLVYFSSQYLASPKNSKAISYIALTVLFASVYITKRWIGIKLARLLRYYTCSRSVCPTLGRKYINSPNFTISSSYLIKIYYLPGK